MDNCDQIECKLISETCHTARKDSMCQSGKLITKGTSYTRSCYKVDGQIQVFKQCKPLGCDYCWSKEL